MCLNQVQIRLISQILLRTQDSVLASSFSKVFMLLSTSIGRNNINY
jgi:hypothetical protein